MSLSKNSKFDLKKKYHRILEVSMIISLSFLVLAFKFFPKVSLETLDNDEKQILFTVVDIPITDPKPKVPPPPKPPIPIEAVSDDILPDIKFMETDLDQDTNVDQPVKIIEDDSEPIPVFDFIAIAEVMPKPIGGLNSILEKIKYPVLAKKADIQGRVIILAYVDENGNVEKAEILKGIGAGCDEEALNSVLATKFLPGKQRGKAVKVKVVIPVLFRLQ